MAKKLGLDRAPIEFQTFYFPHVLVVPPNIHPSITVCIVLKMLGKYLYGFFLPNTYPPITAVCIVW